MAAAIQFFEIQRPARPMDGTPAIDARMVAFMRALLALSALAIIYVDPTEPERFVELTYASLSAYCVWSLILLVGARRDAPQQSPWIDVAWATYLVALTQGTSSIFFFLFIFAILVASFSNGYRSGIAVALASCVLFTVVGMLAARDSGEFELNRSLIRPIYMLGLGWLMAVWGEREIVQRRRLAFLRDVSAAWNPRLGMRRTVLNNLTRMAGFFAAHECLLVLTKAGSKANRATLYKASGAPGNVTSAADIALDGVRPLLELAPGASMAHGGRPATGIGGESARAAKARDVANLLDVPFYASVPYNQMDGAVGRLFISRRSQAFDAEELGFVEQLALALGHVVENTQLIDELVMKAAEHERFRISLDIHDSTVQPYIGLKLGLDALYREASDNSLRPRIGDLLEMADATIRDLRGFATGVRERAPISGDSLLNAVREQAARFRRFYGVEVHLECDENLFVNPTIASEAFRMISEGLSNVMRHTTARRAFVRIARDETELRLVIANDPWGPEQRHVPFTPRSINARAISLGGSSFVEHGSDGSAAVHIAVPV